MSLSKSKLKYIRSLKDKKHRTEHGTFVAEGNKLIADLLPHIKCQLLVATPNYLQGIDTSLAEEVIEVKQDQLDQASYLQNPQQALAVFYQQKSETEINLKEDLILALDGVQDPGNLGTIVRVADWYGIKHIICSNDTADIYNPKVVQATMGAIARVNLQYTDLEYFLKESNEYPIYGTLLDGENMYEQHITSNGIIVMGNEGNGIRPEIAKLITEKLFIPNYPLGELTSESLNVSIATAIICAEFRRRVF